jgi:Lar family restriction alleviation protein
MAGNKTCPFCGSDSVEVYTHYGESAGIQYGGYYPECTVCGCRLNYYESREEALKSWNRRADDGNDSKRADT